MDDDGDKTLLAVATVGCCSLAALASVFISMLIPVAIAMVLLGGSLPGGFSLDEASSSSVTGECASTATISSDIMSLIEQNQSIYEQAANDGNIPWQMLAAIHFREANCNPNLSLKDGGALGSLTLQESANQAVSALKSLALTFYSVELDMDNTPDELKNSFLSYNRGGMYVVGECTADQSPYVMNNFDSNYLQMTWPDSACEPISTRGLTDTRNGAYTVYDVLVCN